MNEHLVREKPKPAEASVILPLYLKNTTKTPAPLRYVVLYQIFMSEINTEGLVHGTDVEE